MIEMFEWVPYQIWLVSIWCLIQMIIANRARAISIFWKSKEEADAAGFISLMVFCISFAITLGAFRIKSGVDSDEFIAVVMIKLLGEYIAIVAFLWIGNLAFSELAFSTMKHRMQSAANPNTKSFQEEESNDDRDIPLSKRFEFLHDKILTSLMVSNAIFFALVYLYNI